MGCFSVRGRQTCFDELNNARMGCLTHNINFAMKMLRVEEVQDRKFDCPELASSAMPIELNVAESACAKGANVSVFVLGEGI
jgi:hypothetical protein